MGQDKFGRAHIIMPPFLYWPMMIVCITLVGIYLYCEIHTFRAFLRYQNFMQGVPSEDSDSEVSQSTAEHSHQILSAIDADTNQAEYYAVFGTHLLQQFITNDRPQNSDLDEARQWLQQAILLDPANPWYYYEIGRLSYYRGDCMTSRPRYFESQEPCTVLRYYLAALQNSPKDRFLRQEVLQWYVHYDRVTALQFLQELRARDRDVPLGPDGFNEARYLAKFLYEIQVDYISDLELEKAQKAKEKYPVQAKDQYLDACEKGVLLLPSSTYELLELGNDDGSAEWQSPLGLASQRIKKGICLPDDLTGYRSAALKIFMNRRSHASLQMSISLNEHQIPLDGINISYIPKWHEIPIDLTLLQHLSAINVYIRNMSEDNMESALNIWGDQDTPTTHSMLNFQITEDLSPSPGRQTGEYMIRLVLRK